ncbi:RtcB family protein [Vibrio coralliirubri]|uniref:RtcB family protein n=1 Tax=Vibrio coralliirubri TaxID=1516159 RepID=UPI0022846C7D|nr:RtcB family protein [Vibrio coralliirubri]MCY9861227.1 RtcB family protein [Vibrio coralliirubri]
MNKTNFIYHQTPKGSADLKMWTQGVTVENSAMEQLLEVASLPFVYKHIAVMPDVHAGMGATIGSVIPTLGAIMPSAVGVDIGCGMMAVQTNLKANDLPKDLATLRSKIEAVIPHGRTENGQIGDKGAFDEMTPENSERWEKHLSQWYKKITTKHPLAYSKNAMRHLSSLGSGNHFVEICLDLNDSVWFMLHSGSRGAGARIGGYFIDLAKKEMDRYFLSKHLPNLDLAYFVEGTELFNDYVDAVHWAQAYATQNREGMMAALVGVVKEQCPQLELTNIQVNCQHNFVRKESHFGKNVWITRKGAVCVREGELGIIPASMGARSYIVEGIGNKDSYHSCSHGAGRKMSRGAARKLFTIEDHKLAMVGIEARTDIDVIDETPMAYKSIDSVMEAQKDLVKVRHELRQILNIKG